MIPSGTVLMDNIQTNSNTVWLDSTYKGHKNVEGNYIGLHNVLYSV